MGYLSILGSSIAKSTIRLGRHADRTLGRANPQRDSLACSERYLSSCHRVLPEERDGIVGTLIEKQTALSRLRFGKSRVHRARHHDRLAEMRTIDSIVARVTGNNSQATHLNHAALLHKREASQLRRASLQEKPSENGALHAAQIEEVSIELNTTEALLRRDTQCAERLSRTLLAQKLNVRALQAKEYKDKATDNPEEASKLLEIASQIQVELEAAYVLASRLLRFNHKLGPSGCLGEIDFETTHAIVECTNGRNRKDKQVDHYLNDFYLNPEKKPVILYAPNYCSKAARGLHEKYGSRFYLARTPDELATIHAQLEKTV